MVKLTDRKKWIQVSYSGVNSYCYKIHITFDIAIQWVANRFQHTGIGPPSVRYLCPLHSDQGDNYCYLSFDQQHITSSQNAIMISPVTPDMLCWMHDNTG